MKKSILYAFCLLGILVILAPALPASAETLIVCTKGGPVNLRKAPDMDARSSIAIPKGEAVEVIAYVNQSFVKVRWKDAEGYVPAQYVKTEEEALKLSYPKGKSVYPDEPMVYVRSAASDVSPVVAAVKWDRPVTILKDGKEWIKAACLNQSGQSVEGYIHASDLAGRNAQPLGGDPFSFSARLREEGEATQDLTLREFPDTQSAVTAQVPKGHTLTVLSIQEPWCKIAVDAYEGWAYVGGVRMTGRQTDIYGRETIPDYKASYYTATPVNGQVTLFPAPTGNAAEKPSGVFSASDVDEWIVLQRKKTAYGQTWTLLWDGKEASGWALAKEVTFSNDMRQWDYGASPVQAYTSAVAYVKEGGAAFFSAGTDLSRKLFTIPAGAELEISLHPGQYAFTSYGGQNGYVAFEQLDTGFAWDRDWWNSVASPEKEEAAPAQPIVDLETARAAAEKALKSLYKAFEPGKLTLKTENTLDTSGIPRYSFAYFQGDDCMYLARVNAQTGACDQQADYTAFVRLSGGDAQVDWDEKAPQKQAKATPRPAAERDVGMEKARSIAEGALKNEFGVDVGAYACEPSYQRQMPGFDGPVYRFNYYADHGYLLCVVDAASGSVAYTSNVYNAEYTEIDYNPPAPKPDYTGMTLLSQAEARQKADAALSAKYPGFSGTAFASVSCRFNGDGEGDPAFGDYTYQFDYWLEDGNWLYECIVNGYTGKILYTNGHLPGEGNG